MRFQKNLNLKPKDAALPKNNPGHSRIPSSGNAMPRPFAKWAGGKNQLTAQLLALAPKELMTYHEPMIGGGALFFALYREGRLKGKTVHLSDLNSELMDTYRAVRNQTEKLIRLLSAHLYDRDYYYLIRDQDPVSLTLAERAARMIYLNRSGFNGLYRVNKQGRFNVPFGRYKNPRICNADNLRAVSAALRSSDVRLHCDPFETVLERAAADDLVYFDPPYLPLSDTAYFVSYAKNGFGIPDQERLAQVFAKLAKQGTKVMLSNSDTPWVREHYRDFFLKEVQARRNINSRAAGRGPISELVVLSYKPESNT